MEHTDASGGTEAAEGSSEEEGFLEMTGLSGVDFADVGTDSDCEPDAVAQPPKAPAHGEPGMTTAPAARKAAGHVPAKPKPKSKPKPKPKLRPKAPVAAVRTAATHSSDSIDCGAAVGNRATAKGTGACADVGADAGTDAGWEGGVVDADDVMERMAEEGWAAALAAGTMTEADVAHARRLRKLKEEVSMCKHMEKMPLPPGEDEAVMLRMSRAHMALRNNWLAIEALRRGLQRLPDSSRLRIQLSKLLFRDDQKELAVQECIYLTEAYAADLAAGRVSRLPRPSPGSLAEAAAAEAAAAAAAAAAVNWQGETEPLEAEPEMAELVEPNNRTSGTE